MGHSRPHEPTNTTFQKDVCQGRCIHPEQVKAVKEHLLPVEQAIQVADLFALLGDATRLQVLSALLQSPTGELCVCDLATGLGRDETTISHQLRVLRTHRVVTMRKVGRVVYYRLTDAHIRHLLLLGITHAREGDTLSLQQRKEVSA